MKKFLKILALSLTLGFSISSVSADATIDKATATMGSDPVGYIEAKVLDVQESIIPVDEANPEFNELLVPNQKEITQTVKVKITSDGKYKNKDYTLTNVAVGRPNDLRIHKGDPVLIQLQKGESGEIVMYIVDYVRSTQVWLYIVLFAVVLLVFGRKSGLTSLLGLLFTFLMIFYVFIPGIMNGYNPLLLALITATIVTIVVHGFVAGYTPKSVSSIIGTIGGVAVAGILGYVFMNWAYLVGLSSEEARNIYLLINPKIDFANMYLAGVVIGSLGAVMDVGISISSAISELRIHAKDPSFEVLFKAGMNIGKDVLGTMSNTLILAYVGAAIPLMIILYSQNLMGMALNIDYIADEIVRSIAGSLGLFATIPITAYIAAKMESKTSNT